MILIYGFYTLPAGDLLQTVRGYSQCRYRQDAKLTGGGGSSAQVLIMQNDHPLFPVSLVFQAVLDAIGVEVARISDGEGLRFVLGRIAGLIDGHYGHFVDCRGQIGAAISGEPAVSIQV